MAPAFTASSTSCCSPLADRISTLVARPPSAAQTSSPLIPGRLRSSTSTSGRVAFTRRTALGPSSAVATTVIPASRGREPRRRATEGGRRPRRSWSAPAASRHPPPRSRVVAGPLLRSSSHTPLPLVLSLGARIRTVTPAPSRPTHSASPPRSRSRPRMLDATPRRPPAAASSSRPTGIPATLSRTVTATVSPSSSRRIHACAESPACSRTLSRARRRRPPARLPGAGEPARPRRAPPGAHAPRHAPRAEAAGRPPLPRPRAHPGSAADEGAQPALLLGGHPTEPGRLVAELAATSVDEGQRLQHPVVHRARQPLALAQASLERERCAELGMALAGEVHGIPMSAPMRISSTMLLIVWGVASCTSTHRRHRRTAPRAGHRGAREAPPRDHSRGRPERGDGGGARDDHRVAVDQSGRHDRGRGEHQLGHHEAGGPPR